MQRRIVIAVLALLVWLLPTGARAEDSPAANALTVVAISVAGKSVVTVDVNVIEPGGSVATKVSIRVAQGFAVGTEIITPARTEIQLMSTNGNRITLDPVTRFKVNTVQGGESYSIGAGSVAFKVSRALNFFHVSYDKFLAIVHGTQFSVDVQPGKRIEFRLSEGRLWVEREVKVRIEETDSVAALRATEMLAEGRNTKVAYRLDVDEYLREFKTLKEAEDYYRDRLREDEQSGDVERTLNGLNALGVVLHLLGKDQEALEVLKRGLVLAEPKADRTLAASFANNLGAVYQRLGQFDHAVAAQQLAIKYRLVLYPDGVHTDIAGSHTNLGAAYFAMGKYDAAGKEFELSLALQRKLYQDELHPGIAQVYNNLGILARTRGHYQEAKTWHEQALAIFLKLYPTAHPSVAGTYTKLGAVNAAIGDYAQAIKQHEQVLAILRKLYPNELHPEIADNYTNLAAIYAAQSQPERSATEHRKALAIRSVLYQPPHPGLALSHADLGAALVDARKFAEALPHLREAQRQLLSLYPDGMHINVAVNQTNLGAALAGLKNYPAAINEYQTTLKLWDRLFNGADHPGTALTLDRLATALLAMGDTRKAIKRFRQALAIRLRLYPDGRHRSVAASYRELSGAWRQAGDQAQAEAYARKQRDVESRLAQ